LIAIFDRCGDAMNIEQLQTLLELNRTRHFRRTAEALHITQSTVSARIRNLEEALGVALFRRDPRNLQLTPAGQRLLRYAESILVLWRRAQQDVAMASEARVQLAVGGLFSLWDILLQDWVARLRENLPQLALAAETHDHSYLLRRLLDGTLDLVFLYDPPQLEEVLCEPVASVRLRLVADRPGLGLEQALGEDYIMVDWGEHFLLQHARLFPDAPVPARRVNQAQLALRFILAGGGSAYLAEGLIREVLAAGLLHPVVGAPEIQRQAHAVYPRRSPQGGLIREALGYLGG